jgi:hypothetical protein
MGERFSPQKPCAQHTLRVLRALSLPADVPRTAAGMFTISYTCAIIIPTICGALWDLTGKPWTAFPPLFVRPCAGRARHDRDQASSGRSGSARLIAVAP